MKRCMPLAFVFLGGSVTKENTTMKTTDVLAGYVQRHSPISPQVEGRITFVTP